jgi:hypothetical protein
MSPLHQPYPLPRRNEPSEELGFIGVKDLQAEARDLSDEEAEFEEKVGLVPVWAFYVLMHRE